jgi:hypothetical protein
MTHVDNSLQSVDDWLVYGVLRHFQKYFSFIVALSFIGDCYDITTE